MYREMWSSADKENDVWILIRAGYYNHPQFRIITLICRAACVCLTRLEMTLALHI